MEIMSTTNMNDTTNTAVAPGDGKPSTFDWESAVAHDIEQALDPEVTTNKPDLAILRIIRGLLHKLEADSHEARLSLVVAAAHDVCEYYRGAYLDSKGEGFYFSQQGDHGSGQMTDMVCSYAWQVAMLFPATDVRHAALAELIAAFKSVCSSAPDVFDAKDPQIKFVNRDLEGVADDFWGKHHITGLDRKLHSGERLQAECDRTVRCSAFLARLLGLGVLSPSVGMLWALRDVREYLAAAEDDAVEDAAWRCRVLAAAQPFIYAGEVLAREVKKQEQSAKPRARLAFTGDAWREWASGFSHAVARAGDGGGDVEMAARAAKGKITELWPSMLTEQARTSGGRADEGKV